MKKSRYLLAFILSIFTAFSLAACGTTTTTGASNTTTVTESEETTTVKEEETTTTTEEEVTTTTTEEEVTTTTTEEEVTTTTTEEEVTTTTTEEEVTTTTTEEETTTTTTEEETTTTTTEEETTTTTTEEETTTTTTVEKSDPELSITTLTKVYDGEAFSVSYTTNSDGDVTIVFYSGSTELESAPSSAGTYAFTITLAETDSYNSLTESYDFTITKADPTYTVPSGLTAETGALLSSVTFTDSHFAWVDGTQTISSGSNSYSATYTPDNTDDYNTATVSVTVTGYSSSDGSYDFEISYEEGTADCYTIVENSNGEYTITFSSITADTEYSISGTLVGNIVIDVDESETYSFQLNLDGVTITSYYEAPIAILSGDSCDISAKKETTNSICDYRAAVTSDDDISSSLYSKVDLKLKGTGTLNVESENNNGIHSTKDLTVQKLTLNVTCEDNALKGNDSVEIVSGTLVLIAKTGDGIKTSDSDISSNGNQRGTVTITGSAVVTIYAACDGIDAAYDVVIEADDDGNEPTINIYTDKYSEYSEEVSTSSTDTYYIRFTSNSYNIAVYYYNSSTDYEYAYAEYYTSATSGRNSTTYYYYKVDKLSDYGSLKVVLYKTSVSSPSYTSSGCSLSTNNMMVLSLSNSTLNVSWSTYSSQSSSQFGGGPGQSQTSSSTEDSYSTKGIKSYNQITISAGTVNIKSYDDAIHANYGETLENGETGVGDVTISGGTVTVYTNDDGIHADRYLNISGGTVTVSYAYEGLEATVINISGGTTTVYSTDDGTNSSQKVSGITVSTNISGGILDITVYGNDVDGIDSNGNYIQTGGTVITRGYGNGGLSTGMDCDGTVSMTGGILVCFGNKPETYSTIKTSSGVKTGSSSSTYSAKTYTIKSSSASVSTTNKYSYSGMYYWSYDGTLTIS